MEKSGHAPLFTQMTDLICREELETLKKINISQILIWFGATWALLTLEYQKGKGWFMHDLMIKKQEKDLM